MRVALLAESEQICTRDTRLLDLGKHPLANIRRSLELRQRIRICE